MPSIVIQYSLFSNDPQLPWLNGNSIKNSGHENTNLFPKISAYQIYQENNIYFNKKQIKKYLTHIITIVSVHCVCVFFVFFFKHTYYQINENTNADQPQ